MIINYGKKENERIMSLSDEQFEKEYLEKLEQAIKEDEEQETVGNGIRQKSTVNYKEMLEAKYGYFRIRRNKKIEEIKEETKENDR